MDAAVIPAYEPDETLAVLVEALLNAGIERIVVVDDGSSPRAAPIFQKLAGKAVILKHYINRGKGAALKTAFTYLLNHAAKTQSVVVLDADGQHRPQDAKKLLEVSHQAHGTLVLGVRAFAGKIPLRSRFGNGITRQVFRLCSGQKIKDTQTGLRAFSADMLPFMLSVGGERYEYEMEVLVACTKEKIPLVQSPAATVYHDKNNSCSHFRTVRDSVRIYWNLLAFAGSSFVSFLVDYLLFFPFVGLFGLVLPGTAAMVCGNIAARILSAGLNYTLNCTFVFYSGENKMKSALQYSTLACAILLFNTLILCFLNGFLGLAGPAAKLITEMFLFVVSFVVQKTVIFKKRGAKLKKGEGVL